MNVRAKLERLAGRGTPRSTAEVWEAANSASSVLTGTSGVRPNRSWAAFAAGFTAVAAVAALTAVIVNLNTSGGPSGSVPQVPVTSTTTEPEGEQRGALSSEFVDWIFPVDPVSYREAAWVIEWPLTQALINEVADCVVSHGFSSVGDAMKNDTKPPLGTGMNRFWMPAPASFEMILWGDRAERPARDILTFAQVPDSTVGRAFWVDQLANFLENRPLFGVIPESAEDLYEALMECREPLDRPPSDLLQEPLALQTKWTSEILKELDSDMTVVAALELVPACLAADRSGFFDPGETAESAFDRFTVVLREVSPDDDDSVDELIRLRDVYYECMQPVVEARRPLRLAAREQMVEENLTRLLQAQSNIQNEIDRLDR